MFQCFLPLLSASCGLSCRERVGSAGSQWVSGLLALTLLLVNGCSSLPELEVTEQSERDWSLRQQHLAAINNWDIRGRAVIFVDDDVYHVGISWLRQGDDFSMVIEAPFGQGVIGVETSGSPGTEAAYKLSLPDGQIRYGESAEFLLTGLLGWSIPVNGLKSWIKGLPQQSSKYSYVLYGNGNLKSLSEDGWSINYLDYFKSAQQSQGLPRKIYMKHRALALKIVLERWDAVDMPDESTVLFPDFN